MGNERSGNGHPPAIHEPGLYRIRVAGRLGREWADRVDGMAIRVQERGPDRTVTDLTGTVADQSEAGQAAADLVATQVAILEADIAYLNEALKTLKQLSKATLEAASDEYAEMESQLAATEEAVAQLEALQSSTEATASELAAAYEAAEQELRATQEALVELLNAVAEAAEDSAEDQN